MRASGVLALLATATACGGEPTPTGLSEAPTVPTAIGTPKTPLAAPLTATVATPAPPGAAAPTPTLVLVAPTPDADVETAAATPGAAATPTSEPTASQGARLSPQPVQPLTISTEGTHIRIAPTDGLYLTLERNLLADLKALAHVSSVERYLVIELGGSTDAAIGVEPGAPLRILRDGEQARAEVYTGEDFTGVDAGANFAIAGASRPLPGMEGMVHELLVGQTFTILGYPDRIRVVGKYVSDARSQDFNSFFPIETAQKAFGKEGKVSYLFVTVDSPENVARAEEDLRVLLSVR